METLLVGGAVRDALLGRPVAERDWVVIGATPQAMIDAGFRPVGREFPVFIHPQTGDEYALARTERKVAPGYAGFTFHAAPEVTIEQDLSRRDLTINAIAQRADGTLVDPFGGVADLRAGVLRHVSSAFAEDPVRVLRLARFAARWPDFTIASETMALAREIVERGEVDALVPERVWKELSRGLMEPRPSRLFTVLKDCGALARLLPEVDRLWGVPQRPEHHPEVDTGVHLMMVIDLSARLGTSLPVRWACVCHDLGKGTTPRDQWPRHLGHEQRSVKMLRAIGERLRVHADCTELAEVVAREHGHVHASGDLGAAALLRLLERCDAIRRPDRFGEVLRACECDHRGRLGFEDRPYPQRDRLRAALERVLAVDTAAIAADAAARGLAGPAVGDAIRRAREQAVAAGLSAPAA